VLGFAADENFNNNIIRGLLRRKPDLDILRVQDAFRAKHLDHFLIPGRYGTHDQDKPPTNRA
jgi:hypothetical protein